MRVLIIEDDIHAAKAVQIYLTRKGILADVADCGTEGLERAKRQDYDAIILDLVLPDIGGLLVLCRLRQSKIETPVLILSGLTEVETRVAGLKAGADDYLTKPFAGRELLARLRAIVRRAHRRTADLLRVGPLEINLHRGTARVGTRQLRLTRTEFKILEMLAVHRGAAVSRQTILGHLYRGADVPTAGVVPVFICKIRQKLADHGAPGVIQSVWGQGYALRKPDRTKSAGRGADRRLSRAANDDS